MVSLHDCDSADPAAIKILERVLLNEPADWASSLVCVEKLDGSICVSLDPKDLNVAFKREHYPITVSR